MRTLFSLSTFMVLAMTFFTGCKQDSISTAGLASNAPVRKIKQPGPSVNTVASDAVAKTQQRRIPKPQGGSGTTCVDTPQDFWFYNDCCGQMVHITGMYHFCYNIDENGDYRIHANWSSMQINGVEHGNFVLSNEQQHFNPNNDGSEFVLQGTEHITNQNGCGFTLFEQDHIIVDANGNVRVESQIFNFNCD